MNVVRAQSRNKSYNDARLAFELSANTGSGSLQLEMGPAEYYSAEEGLEASGDSRSGHAVGGGEVYHFFLHLRMHVRPNKSEEV
jgi:hypothetical protein